MSGIPIRDSTDLSYGIGDLAAVEIRLVVGRSRSVEETASTPQSEVNSKCQLPNGWAERMSSIRRLTATASDCHCDCHGERLAADLAGLI